ncbi:MAG: thiamine pyrophosphate-binding protein, partial [Rhodospirillales bacterium]
MTRTAAQALVETLTRHGVDRVFCVPGESYLAALDALYDRPEIQTVACRHEGGAGFMA